MIELFFQAEFLCDAVDGANQLLAAAFGGAANLGGDRGPFLPLGAEVGELKELNIKTTA